MQVNDYYRQYLIINIVTSHFSKLFEYESEVKKLKEELKEAKEFRNFAGDKFDNKSMYDFFFLNPFIYIYISSI